MMTYLDPGTGSLMLQVLVGFLFAALVLLKIYWTKVKKIFVRIFFRYAKHDSTKG